jgi:hypothetical protein
MSDVDHRKNYIATVIDLLLTEDKNYEGFLNSEPDATLEKFITQFQGFKETAKRRYRPRALSIILGREILSEGLSDQEKESIAEEVTRIILEAIFEKLKAQQVS